MITFANAKNTNKNENKDRSEKILWGISFPEVKKNDFLSKKSTYNQKPRFA